MIRVSWSWILVVLLVGGCKSEPTCDVLARRNAKCADAFVEAAKDRARQSMAARIESLPPASRAKARANMEARFDKAANDVRKTLTSDEFRLECHRDWNNPEKMPAALKHELDRCLEQPDCPSYAKCFIASAKLSP